MTDVGLFSFFMWVSSFPISICPSSSVCFWHFVYYKMVVLNVLIFMSLIVFHLSTFSLCDWSILISTALLYNLRSGMHIHFKNHCKDILLFFFSVSFTVFIYHQIWIVRNVTRKTQYSFLYINYNRKICWSFPFLHWHIMVLLLKSQCLTVYYHSPPFIHFIKKQY